MRRADLPDAERVVVTGLGAVTSLGADARASWARLVLGESGIRDVTRFPVAEYRTRIAAEVVPVADGDLFDVRQRRRLSLTDRIAVRAALEAMADARIAPGDVPPGRGAVLLGAGASGLREAEQYHEALRRRGPRRARPSGTLCYFPNATTDNVAARLGLDGFRSTVVTACSSSALSVGQAYDLLRRGRADVAVTGGADTLSLLTFAGFNALRATDVAPCRPFDRERAGLSLGEAAAILVLEPLSRARARDARVYAELLGYGVRCDAHHMTAPHPEGDGAYRTMRDALSMARVDAADVGYVNAHGTATPLNDRSEALAIRRLFGPDRGSPWVSSVKGAFGHCLGAAGAVEALACVLSLHHGIVPPTLHWENPDPECDVDCVPNHARERRYDVALSNSFAFGGNNGALVLGALGG